MTSPRFRASAAALIVVAAVAAHEHASARQAPVAGELDSLQPDGRTEGIRGDGWQVVWADEFERPGLPDPAKWSYETGGSGWGQSRAAVLH